MARPARVRIRKRKPCFLWRRRLFGWYVRFDTLLLHLLPVVETASGRKLRDKPPRGQTEKNLKPVDGRSAAYLKSLFRL